MNVKDKNTLGFGHSIEWGEATWDNTENSIRNRYDNADNKFNVRGSSEVPWTDFNTMILESLSRKKFNNTEAQAIRDELKKSYGI
ncbi:hypothetical protein ACNKXS_03285 [Christiangramia marina]|uniref:hypothetical protein n=1 Tax=Christiangramia marina TaxID=409436 RepID=UPI003AA99126